MEAVLSERQGSVLAGLVLGAPCAEASSLSDAQARMLCTEEKNNRMQLYTEKTNNHPGNHVLKSSRVQEVERKLAGHTSYFRNVILLQMTWDVPLLELFFLQFSTDKFD